MEQRVARLEQAMTELLQENRQLRAELEVLRAQVQQSIAAPSAETSAQQAAGAGTTTAARRWWSSRWSLLALGLIVVVVPVLAFSLGHVNAFWSTIIGSLNALFFYFVGPGAVRLLIEGLVRAIPGIALGQTTRIFVDKMRARRAR